MPEDFKIRRVVSPEAEEILGEKFPVLDKGFIRLVDYMGSDSSIVQAARVSYGKGTKKRTEDRGLIRYLMRHKHTTPFEMVELKFHVRTPMDCWRQWIRHRTASVNEYSTRYSIAIEDAQETSPENWRTQSKTNKQGSGEFINRAIGEKLSKKEKEFHRIAREIYQERIDKGVAREQARKDLPLSTYTEAYWKIDLHNLFHFLRLRMDSHAQLEIRSYAETIADITKKVAPIAYEAFEDYSLKAISFSSKEQEVLKKIIREEETKNIDNYKGLRKKDNTLNREGTELSNKLKQLFN